ncbi:hypothetical protein E8E12_007520 [Didymella heteroderae]|uniref:DUF7730 domain-containing protein n=1 Tax=Didymella heteroderae TaxID=1769908 RepID=A0A9P4WPR0_9PLEO|nr:hypothetical protein E8E12_007520 [Didymella heteroderae]
MVSQESALGADQTVNFPQLLHLPKELRLEIWRYTVTDPSTDGLVVHIDTDFVPVSALGCHPNQRPGLSLRQHSRFQRTFKTSFSKPRKQPINVAVLRSSRLVYEEALPLLYHSITFCPSDAAFAPFLMTLSDLAKSHIRHVRLAIDLPVIQAAGPSWSVKCAQVARLPGLRVVEIESGALHQAYSFHAERIQEKILWPLLKIKAPKRMTPADDNGFQEKLAKAAETFAAEKQLRTEHAEWEHVEFPSTASEEEEPLNTRKPLYNSPDYLQSPLTDALKRAVAANLHVQDDPAPREAEKDKEEEDQAGEASDWDIVSVASSSSTLSDRSEVVRDI